MQFRHAVDGKAADDGQISHAYLLFIPFLNQRHAAQTLQITRPAGRHLRQEAGIDIKNDFKQSWQHPLEQPYRPPLQSLG